MHSTAGLRAATGYGTTEQNGHNLGLNTRAKLLSCFERSVANGDAASNLPALVDIAASVSPFIGERDSVHTWHALPEPVGSRRTANT